MQIKQFYSIFPNGTLYKTALDSVVSSEKLKYIKIHTAIWKFYLLIFPNTDSLCVAQENWMPIIESKRKEFNQIQEKHHIPSQFDFSLDSMGPLSKNEKSKWNQYHKDNELKIMISRDTSRLFQEIPFFRDETNIENINEIIFLHLRNFPEIEYCQGFHEICAIIYYYFCQEMTIQKETNCSTEIQNTTGFDFIFSSDYIIADTFWIYTKIVEYIYKYYEDSNDTTVIAKTCYDILQIYMKRIDWDVSQKLTDSNLNIMMYQWFRILFGRIFSFDQINQIWTFVFSFYPEDKILSNTTIALILSKKNDILSSTDPTGVLIIFKNMYSESARNIIKIINKLQQPKQKSIKNKDKKDKLLYKYQQKKENQIKMRRSLFEPISTETEKLIPEICTKPKEEIIEQLKKFRDIINAVSILTYPQIPDEGNLFADNDDSNETANESYDNIANIDNDNDNSNENENNDNDDTNNDNDDIKSMLPRATSGKLTDVKADTSLLTKEDEKVFRRNKSNIFTKPTNPEKLFE